MKIVFKPTNDPEADKKISIVFANLLKIVKAEKAKEAKKQAKAN